MKVFVYYVYIGHLATSNEIDHVNKEVARITKDLKLNNPSDRVIGIPTNDGSQVRLEVMEFAS